MQKEVLKKHGRRGKHGEGRDYQPRIDPLRKNGNSGILKPRTVHDTVCVHKEENTVMKTIVSIIEFMESVLKEEYQELTWDRKDGYFSNKANNVKYITVEYRLNSSQGRRYPVILLRHKKPPKISRMKKGTQRSERIRRKMNLAQAKDEPFDCSDELIILGVKAFRPVLKKIGVFGQMQKNIRKRLIRK